MDAAAAAAMSDPLLNRWFCRRWAECGPTVIDVSEGAIEAVPLEHLGLELLAEWRRGRVDHGSTIL